MCLSKPKANTDPRYTLTPWERESVKQLKDACEEHGVTYKSIFELAKYVLVSKSVAKDKDPKADAKRLKEALERITRKRQWEKDMGIDQLDISDVYQELYDAAPGYGLFNYRHDREGHAIVSYQFAYAPSKYVCESQENADKGVMVAQKKMDLAAADMEEARRGIALVGICDGKVGMTEALNYVRMLKACKGATGEMNATRVRRVYVQAPSVLVKMVNVAKMLLNKKLRDRLVLFSTVPALEKKLKIDTEQRDLTAQDWFKERTKIYNETVNKLTL